MTTSAAAFSQIDNFTLSLREEKVINAYAKETSVDPNPFEFPFLESRTTVVSELYKSPLTGEITDTNVLWTTLESFGVDEFGNPTSYDRATAKGEGGLILETHSTDTFYDIRPNDWLISLVRRVEDSDSPIFGIAHTRTSEFTYDARGLLNTHTREPDDIEGSDYYQLVTTYARSPQKLWNVDMVTVDDTDATTPQRGMVLEYDDDEIFVDTQTQRVETQLGVVDHVTQFTYDERHGQVSTIVDSSHVTIRIAFDGFGRPRRQEQAGEVTTIDYKTANPQTPPNVRAVLRTTSETLVPHQGGTLLRTSAREVDSFGRTVRTLTSAPRPLHQEISYDHAGRVEFISKPDAGAFNPNLPNLGTSYHYDARQRLVQQIYPDGTSSSFDYAVTHGEEGDDYLGIDFTMPSAVSYKRTTDPNANVTLHALDVRGNRIRCTGPVLPQFVVKRHCAGHDSEASNLGGASSAVAGKWQDAAGVQRGAGV